MSVGETSAGRGSPEVVERLRSRPRCRHHTPRTTAAQTSGVKTINAPAQNMLNESMSSFMSTWYIIGAETG